MLNERISETDFTFRPFSELAPSQPQNIEVLEYWETLRGRAKLPRWSQFDALDITKNLSGCMIMHVEDQDTSRVLLFGTDLVESFGIDLSGMNLQDLYSGEERVQGRARTLTILQRPAAGLAIFSGQTAGGGAFTAEVLSLPFANEDGTIDHLLQAPTPIDFIRHQPNVILTVGEETFSNYRFYDL